MPPFVSHHSLATDCCGEAAQQPQSRSASGSVVRLEPSLGHFPSRIRERLLPPPPSTARFASSHPSTKQAPRWRSKEGMGRRTLWGTRSSTDSEPRSLEAWPTRCAAGLAHKSPPLMNSSLAPSRQPGGPQRISCNKMDGSRLEAAQRTSQCVCTRAG